MKAKRKPTGKLGDALEAVSRRKVKPVRPEPLDAWAAVILGRLWLCNVHLSRREAEMELERSSLKAHGCVIPVRIVPA